MKTTKSKVRLLGFGSADSVDAANTPHGPMLPGPSYDHYRRLSDFHASLESLYSALTGWGITKADALKRIDALEMPVSTYSDIEQGVAGLKSALAEGRDHTRPLIQLKSGLAQLQTAVGFAATDVPQPPNKHTVPATSGQPLGTGAYQRWLHE
jgi:hypothetical protein